MHLTPRPSRAKPTTRPPKPVLIAICCWLGVLAVAVVNEILVSDTGTNLSTGADLGLALAAFGNLSMAQARNGRSGGRVAATVIAVVLAASYVFDLAVLLGGAVPTVGGAPFAIAVLMNLVALVLAVASIALLFSPGANAFFARN